MSISEGAKREVMQRIQLLGLNNINIRSLKTVNIDEEQTQITYSLGLSTIDKSVLKQNCPNIKYISSVKEVKSNITFPKKKLGTRVLGVEPEYFPVMNLTLKQGRNFSNIDLENYNQVCILGAKLKAELFGLKPCLGEKVNFANRSFEVIGVLDNRETADTGSGKTDKTKLSTIQVRDISKDLYVPLTTLMKKVVKLSDTDRITEITVQVNDDKHVLSEVAVIKTILDKLHHNVEDYEIIVPRELLRQSQETQAIFNIVLGCIAGISLLVGGIGVMNIMLATVTERTREIGIRRAMGATKTDIIQQFLVETSVLSGLGGVIGILLGLIAVQIISLYSGWATAVSINIIIISFVVSVTIGIVFGLYPADKAANLDPVEALRYE